MARFFFSKNQFLCVISISAMFVYAKGVTYDHVEMNLYLNGKNMNCPASGIRGTVYPVVCGKW